jgi:hypothetical protein
LAVNKEIPSGGISPHEFKMYRRSIMQDLRFQFGKDEDGEFVTLQFGLGTSQVQDVTNLELALLFHQEDPKNDPIQGPAFGLSPARLKELMAQVHEEPLDPEGHAMVPEEVLTQLLRRATAGGHVGPDSSRVLHLASKALGLTREQIRGVIQKK